MLSPQRESKSKVCGKARMKHCSSDTDLHLHRKDIVRDDRRYSLDDSFLNPHPLPLGPSTIHSHNVSSTPRRWKEIPTRKEVPPKTKSHMYVLRSDQWASLSRATLADLRLKQELKRGNKCIMTFFCGCVILRFKCLPITFIISCLTSYKFPYQTYFLV